MYNNLVTDIGSLIVSGLGTFANRFGSALTDLVGNIFITQQVEGTFDYSLAILSGQNPFTLTEDLDLNVVYPGFDDFLTTYNFTYTYSSSSDTILSSGKQFYGNTNGIQKFSLGTFDSSYSVVSAAALEYFGNNSMIGDSQSPYLSISYSTTQGATTSSVGVLNVTTSYHLNAFGFVTIAFTGLALMFGLARWIVNICTSLGKRNK